MVAAVAAASLASPNTTAAQSRAVARPSTQATGHAVARPVYHYPAYRPSYRYAYPYRGYGYGYPYYGYGYPYYGTSFAFGIGFGFGWGYPYYGYSHYGYPFYYGGYGYPYGGPYPYQYGYYDSGGAARLEVKPREAEVYIDGYLVGTVDNFDGWAQRLNVAPGEHELVIYLKGHHTFRQNVLFRPGATMRVEHVMQPLGPGDAEEPRPVPDRTAGRGPARRDPQDYPPAEDYPRQPGEPVPAPRRGADQPPSGQSDQYGSLAVRVQPLDAEVLVDGETWQSPDAGSITLQLSDGVHRVEVRKAGYRTYSAEVRVRRGDSTAVNVSLSRQ
jgi:hypothetical protein